MTSKELKENHDRISDQIRSLNSELRDIESQMNVLHKERLSQLVGLCYRAGNDDYIKVIGVPDENPTMKGNVWNPYQIPVLVLPFDPKDGINTGLIPFYEDTAYSLACDSDDPVGTFFREHRQELSPQDFDARMKALLKGFLLDVDCSSIPGI